MKVLAINCGSSTLKFQVIEVEEEAAPGRERRLASGTVDRIGGRAAIEFAAENGERLQEAAPVADHGEATQRVLVWLGSCGFLEPDGLVAIGHRVVHGGEQFVEPTLIDDEAMDAIEAVSDLAPLHNEPSLRAIRAARAVLGPAIPMVAIFDTAFHRTMPERASRYAIPQDLAAKHRIRRYGFHGLAHRYMTERYAAITSTPMAQAKLITLQLGNGCSATAVEGGRSLDTSMGFTPLEGLMMGTRSGDVDPSLAAFLARREGVSVEEVEGWLNTRSGLLGVSGRSRDMRELLEAERQGDQRAALAVEMFCYRVRKYIGAYLSALGGAHAVVFGGGIGENAPTVRARICAGMDWCGLTLDQDRNAAAIGVEERISADNVEVHAYVIPVDEAVIIARDTAGCLLRQRRG
ncbi:MAG: acetate kinase [Dehalococcoidia bacterium]|nr:acetate kinase [Dehalococcoidia bacterium]